MIRRLSLLVLLVLFCAVPAFGFGNVNGTITDQGGQVWFEGTIQFLFRPAASNPSAQYYFNGAPFSSSTTIPANPQPLDSTGHFSLTVPGNDAISPANSQWTVTVCPAATVPNCFTKNLTITTSTQDISSQMIPPAAVVNLTVPLLGARAYTDSEIVGAAAGTSYLNVTDNTLHLCIQSGFPPCTWNSIVSSTALLFAENYPNVQAAMNACPTNGCTVIASSPAVNMNLGSLDPGLKTITLILGPYSYSATQIALRPSFQLIGAGLGVGIGGSPPATIITSDSTTTPLIVLGGSTAVQGVNITNLRFYCGAPNTTQVGLDIVAPQGGGLWNSNFNNIAFGGDGAHECGGGAIVLDGSAGGSPFAINQFLNFTSVYAFRTQGGAPAFHVIGVGGQIVVTGGQYDGQTPRDTLPNIVIEDSAFAGFAAAYNIAFHGTTSQRAGTAIKLRGSTDVSFDNMHYEDVTGILDAAMGLNYGNKGVSIRNSYCATACAQNSGSGFLTKTDAASQVSVDYLSLFGTPDNYWTGTSIASLEHQGLLNFSSGTTYPAPNSSFRIPVGIDNDSAGYKHKRVATGSIGGGTRINSTVTWTTPFVDTNYTVTCSVIDATTAPTNAGLVFERLNASPSAAGITVTVFNPTGGVINGTLECIATHD